MKYKPKINDKYSYIIDLLREKVRENNPEQEWMVDNLIFVHVGGSHLYGTNTKDSDLDIRGITIPPKSFWVGARVFDKPYEAKIESPDLDFVIYDVRKWLRLSVDMNPNVVESLFATVDHALILNSAVWSVIYAATIPLMNQRAYVGYHGYSTAQLKKMAIKQANKTGRQYITEQLGFDLKFASHGFRLARQGAELLKTGNIIFPRPDKNFLLDVRQGKVYGPEDINKCIEDWSLEAQKLDKAYRDSCLPVKADFNKYNQLLEDIYDNYVKEIK